MNDVQNHRAERLEDVGKFVGQQPLRPGDPRYVPIPLGRDSNAVRKLRICVEDHDAEASRFAKVVFLGHRGCGKTTELFRLEHDLSGRFVSLHLTPDESLLTDFDYTDLLLWLVENLVQKFAGERHGLDHSLVDRVVGWFAEVSIERVEKVKKTIEINAEAGAKAKLGLYWMSIQLLARIKSMMVGDVERRKTMRQTLQSYSAELIRKVNLLLDDARRALRTGGGTHDLLIVQDNLDRLPIEPSGTGWPSRKAA